LIRRVATTETKEGDRRPALDGIRAIAVLLVFGFHAKVPGLGGGFLGVDLFFVLSGYLITSLLLTEGTATGRIDVPMFWTRRVRRLLPAFFVLACVVTVHGAYWAPDFLRGKLKSDVLASLFYVANWRFIASSSYFANDGVLSPLQHVWSLAIEEQFYLFWPLLIFAVCKFAPGKVLRGASTLAGVLGAISLLLLVYRYTAVRPERAYMGTDSRAFEPLGGALLACAFRVDAFRAWCGRFRHALYVLGAIGVAIGVKRFGHEGDIRPEYFKGGAFGFTVATCALLAGLDSGPSPVRTVLSTWPMRKFGAISYGFYLWHWPIIIWLSNGDTAPTPMLALKMLAFTTAASTLSFVALETPIRYGAWISKRRPAVTAGATAILFAGLSGLVFYLLKPPPKTGFTILMVGDSVPKYLTPQLAPAAKERGWQLFEAARGNCSVFAAVPTDIDGKPYGTEPCKAEMPKAQTEAIVANRPDVVVWWSRYDSSHRLGRDGKVLVAGTKEFWDDQAVQLRATIERLTANGAHLLFVEQDRPGMGMNGRCSPSNCPWFLRLLVERYDLAEQWNKMVREVASIDNRVSVVSLDNVFCHDTNVPCDDTVGPGAWARPDGTHFAAVGGAAVTAALLDHIAKMQNLK
jgi:peptidoglycan/LPS O-acetylase OafA/YrhL